MEVLLHDELSLVVLAIIWLFIAKGDVIPEDANAIEDPAGVVQVDLHVRRNHQLGIVGIGAIPGLFKREYHHHRIL